MNILIAEDDPSSSLILEATLTMMGHALTVTENGAQAWEHLQRTHFDVLISDWMMPEMDGLELCRRLRARPTDQYTNVILLTSLGGKANYLEAMNAGADDFITKPFEEDQLAARLVVAERQLGLRRQMLQLEGLLPICAYCKRIRDEVDKWKSVESYVAGHSGAKFSHGICPECSEKWLKELDAKVPPP